MKSGVPILDNYMKIQIENAKLARKNDTKEKTQESNSPTKPDLRSTGLLKLRMEKLKSREPLQNKAVPLKFGMKSDTNEVGEALL